MERREYMTFDMTKPHKDATQGPARLGADGWEAVAMVSSCGVGWRFVHPIALLKRPLPAMSPTTTTTHRLTSATAR
jgi:hypothetical protein